MEHLENEKKNPSQRQCAFPPVFEMHGMVPHKAIASLLTSSSILHCQPQMVKPHSLHHPSKCKRQVTNLPFFFHSLGPRLIFLPQSFLLKYLDILGPFMYSDTKFCNNRASSKWSYPIL